MFIQNLPDIVLGNGDTVLNKIDKLPAFVELMFYRVDE